MKRTKKNIYPAWSFSGDMYCHICFEQDRKKERKY